MKYLKSIIVIIVFTLSASALSAQAFLQADGPGNTYELINSVLAPGYDAVEHPECAHPGLGRHIAEVWDTDLNKYVFEFYIHVTPDNDRCINFDRQRMEIKTYDSSPNNLKGVAGETVTYKWKFKLPIGFKPSSNFTHIHQIKAVGGNADDPIFTLTPRKGSPNKLELIHNNSTKVVTVNLSSFEGVWVECTEVIKVGTSGTYSMVIRKVSDGTTLLSYGSTNILTIRSDNDFIRPKWGIYRSLLSSSDLRDEAVRFSDFYIREGGTADITCSSNPVTGGTVSGTGTFNVGSSVTLSATANAGYSFVNWTENSIEVSKNSTYTFLLSENRNLIANFQDITSLKDEGGLPDKFILFQNYPNPFNPSTVINYTIPEYGYVKLKIFDLLGREVSVLVSKFQPAGNYNSQFSILNLPAGRQGSRLPSGVYIYELTHEGKYLRKKMQFIK